MALFAAVILDSAAHPCARCSVWHSEPACTTRLSVCGPTVRMHPIISPRSSLQQMGDDQRQLKPISAGQHLDISLSPPPAPSCYRRRSLTLLLYLTRPWLAAVPRRRATLWYTAVSDEMQVEAGLDYTITIQGYAEEVLLLGEYGSYDKVTSSSITIALDN